MTELIKTKVKDSVLDYLESSEEPLNKDLLNELSEFWCILSEDSMDNYHFIMNVQDLKFKEEHVAVIDQESVLFKINESMYMLRGNGIHAVLIYNS